MARRRKQASRSGGNSWGQIAIVVLLIVAVAVADYFGWIELDDITGGDGSSTEQSEPTNTSGEWYEVYFTEPGTESHWPEEKIIEAVDGATERVWIAVFDFELEGLTEAMIRAQERGVDVRLVIDADNEGLPAIETLYDNEVPVQTDTRDALMHNKFIVVDQGETWTGSMNLTDNDVLRHNNNFLRFWSEEMNQNYAAEFSEMWEGEFGPRSPATTPHPSLAFGSSQVDVYFSPEDEPRLALLEALNGAEEDIHFMAFTFTDEAVAETLIAAERRGVTVTGVFETFQANTSYSQFDRLYNLDFPVRKDGNGGIMHHKVFIIDGETVVTGSYNFTDAAYRANDESMLVIRDAGIAAAYLEQWEKVWAEAEE